MVIVGHATKRVVCLLLVLLLLVQILGDALFLGLCQRDPPLEFRWPAGPWRRRFGFLLLLLPVPSEFLGFCQLLLDGGDLAVQGAEQWPGQIALTVEQFGRVLR